MSTSRICSHCRKITVDAWVHLVNQKAAYIDEWAASMHPSSWHEALADDRDEYRRIARMDTCSCDTPRDRIEEKPKEPPAS